MKKIAIFDLDGTLLDTIVDLGTAVNHALAAMALPTHPIDRYPDMVGNGVRRLVTRALPDHLRDDATVDRCLDHFTQYYDAHLHDFTKPYPGIPEMLDTLNARGIALAVTSNKYDSAVKRLISNFFPDVPWIAVLGSIPERERKPSPAIVDEVLALASISHHDAIYIGDSAVDILTARAAQVESVAVTWGFRPLSELRDNNPDHIVSSPDDIPPLTI